MTTKTEESNLEKKGTERKQEILSSYSRGDPILQESEELSVE